MKKTVVTQINTKLHLILFIVTATIWEPFYYFYCFLGLNQLADLPIPKSVPSPKNSAIGNLFISLTIIGIPFTSYRRFKLLHEYIHAMDEHLGPLPKNKNDTGEEIEQKRLNCITPKKYLGFLLATYLILATMITCYVVSIYYLAKASSLGDNLWGNGAYMILLIIAIATTFMGVAFTARTVKEEKIWIKAFNAIITELSS